MKKFIKAFSAALVLLLAAGLLPWGGMRASAEPVVTDSGSCGVSAQYSRTGNDDGTYTLEITGSGAITDGFFASKTALSVNNVIIGNGITATGDRTFKSFNAESITLPSGLETIGSSAFSSSALKSINFPDGLKTISSEAFSYANIPSAVLPASVETIYGDSFSNCYALGSITFQGSSVYITNAPLSVSQRKNTEIRIPCNFEVNGTAVTKDNKNSFFDNDNIDSVTFFHSPEHIEAAEPACVADGNYDYWKCGSC